MDKIYLDNAATTFPKPPAVAQAVYDYMTGSGANINRGCYNAAYAVEEQVLETRQLLCELFHGPDCRNVVFTSNITASLNVLLKGFLRPGDHVLTSSMEHNAVMRPLVQLEKAGVSFTRIPCDRQGRLDVDSAQTAGVLEIDMAAAHIDALAFTGHKGLLGPQGTGGFVLTDELSAEIEPLLSGGTGSLSHTEDVPGFLPDRFEPGTLNLPGILGLRQGLLFLRETGLAAVRDHERTLAQRFREGLRPLENAGLLRVLADGTDVERVGVVSVQTLRRELSQAAFDLDDRFGIQTRVGLHCAPAAHKTLDSYPVGSIRFSFGWYNTGEETDLALSALEEVCHGA